MRRSLVIAGLVAGLALVFGLAISWLAPPTSDRPAEPGPDPELAGLDGYESSFYPYLNDRPTFANRSPVNVVMKANLSDVLTALRERSEVQWNQTEPADEDDRNQTEAGGINITGTGIAWGQAKGTTRWGYVHDGGESVWVRESAQMHDGDYFGYRHHIRLYESPRSDEPWVAMQVHSEHFDWFTLRHAVDGVQDAQHRLESDFMDQPYVERLWRKHLGNDGASDSDGWATVIELAVAIPIGLAMVRTRQHREGSAWRAARGLYGDLRDRITPRHGALAAAVAGLLLGVRWAGLMLEHHVPALSMHTIGGLLYPVLALGIPLAVFAIARGIDRRADAGMTAAGALGAAIVLDYVYLGVDVLPIDILVHRVALVTAIGLVAAGSARRAARLTRFNATIVIGLSLWFGLLLATLLGWV